jgi:hypothetical protein
LEEGGHGLFEDNIPVFSSTDEKKKEQVILDSNPAIVCSGCLRNTSKASPLLEPALFLIPEDNTEYEGVTKGFRTVLLERELQMIQLSATRCSCIAIL